MAILNSLMDISEAETGTMKLAFEDVNLAELIHEVTDLYEHVADEAQVRVTTDVPPVLSLRADRTRLRQAVANLVDNAIKYTPSGGRVEIAATRAEREVLSFGSRQRRRHTGRRAAAHLGSALPRR